MANEYEKALAHAKAGRLETAQSILISLEDERSERLLQKVNAALAARGKPATPKLSQDEVAKGMHQYEQERLQRGCTSCLWFIVVLVACSVVFIVWTNITYQ